MIDRSEVAGRLYFFTLSYLNDLTEQIKGMQSDLELFYLDLEDACDLTGAAREAALARIEEHFQSMRARRKQLEQLHGENERDFVKHRLQGP